jgi:hypothetical protein
LSPIRAAGLPPIMTVEDPLTMTSVGPTQMHMSPTLAAGIPEIMTVGQHAGIMGPPTCGTGPLNAGQVCMSEIREAGGIWSFPGVFEPPKSATTKALSMRLSPDRAFSGFTSN